MSATFFKTLLPVLLGPLLARGTTVTVQDPDGVLGAARAPVVTTLQLAKRDRRAALEGRLQLREVSSLWASRKPASPTQPLSATSPGAPVRLCWQMPPGAPGKRRFRLHRIRHAPLAGMTARQDSASGQFEIADSNKPVLRYNYATVEPGDLLTTIAPVNLIYARARSDYIHPLFGLDGETLTKDWSVDHPHHRGIYWVWPEVDWRGQRGDLHALQHVFARPTGNCTVKSGPVFSQIEAENVWKWEYGEALVEERAIIRAYHATGGERFIDFEFQFTALNDPVSLARRGTEHYGGLNIRLAKVLDQEIVFHTDPTTTVPCMAWAEMSGRFGESAQPCGLVVLQHSANPCYPGDWVKYPELNWFQPTFPTSGTRYGLTPGEPLVLRYRLWLHRGAKAGNTRCAAQWRAYNSPFAPISISSR